MYLELVWLPCSDQLGHQEVCVEKVHVLIQEAMEDQQAVRPRGDGLVRPWETGTVPMGSGSSPSSSAAGRTKAEGKTCLQ